LVNSSERPRRSVLYVPAANLRALEKARALACDAMILDLEDAVAPDAKSEARRNLVGLATAGAFGASEVIVRVNGLDTAWGREDLEAFEAAGLDALLIPKIQEASDIQAYRACVSGWRRPPALWCMVETAAALFHLLEIATAVSKAGPGALVMGSNDLCKELGARATSGREALLAALTMTVAAGKVQGVTVLDGVFNDFGDTDGFRQECEQAVRLGFDGKTLIHPSQVAACNAVFTPQADEISEAREIVAAFAQPENHAAGVLRLGGRMVERLHLAQAQRLLARAGQPETSPRRETVHDAH
jgi:citrate lyase subunit beta/citryl-CoA lyase